MKGDNAMSNSNVIGSLALINGILSGGADCALKAGCLQTIVSEVRLITIKQTQ